MGARTSRTQRACTALACLGLLLTAACDSNTNSSTSGDGSDANSANGDVASADGSLPAGSAGSDSPAGEGATTDRAAVPDDCPDEARHDDDSFETVELEDIGGNDSVTVSAALFPLPDTEGNPWSQWGRGVVLPDGRFVSAVGDHLGQDGTSWFYEYDPATNELTRTSEVSEALGHVAGDWGYGKIHAPMVLTDCGTVITATYWGTRRDLVLGESYQGDQLIGYDPNSREITSLGVPVTGFGLPSIAITPDGDWIFGEAVDPVSDPDAGTFFVADADTGEVVHVDDNPDHVGFRSILVSADGEGMYAAGGGDVVAVEPESGDSRLLDGVLPGDWLRASTTIGPDGSVYGTTRDPDALFSMDANGEFTDLGELEDYVASIALSPDGRTLYYVPGAHGSGWEYGTPLIAVDVETGEHRELVRLNDLVESGLDVRAGGTYNVVVDPGGERIYVGLNAGPIDDDEDAFGQVVLAVVDLE